MTTATTPAAPATAGPAATAAANRAALAAALGELHTAGPSAAAPPPAATDPADRARAVLDALGL
ncbi:hypothetical protein ABZ641_13345, partial [Kitasatospora sp. NPDC007106]